MLSQQKLRAIGIALAVIGLFDATARAADGTWTNTAGGTWSTPGNWAGGTVADGAGNLANTASFNSLDLTADATVVVDTVRTNGNLVFGDTDPSTPANWILSGSSLTLSGPKPTISVSNLNTASKVTISSLLVGTNVFAPNGLTVIGDSRLDLTAANIFTNLLLDHAILGLSVVQSPGVNLTNNIITLTNG